MPNFYVGQRVRIKWSISWPELSGQEGTITGLWDGVGRAQQQDCTWMVAPDSWGTHRAPYPADSGANVFCPSPDQLEPLTDCYDKIEWSECIWMPEEMMDAVNG